jgi:hypothetical protein
MRAHQHRLQQHQSALAAPPGSADEVASCVQCGATPSGTEVPRCIGDADLQRHMRAYSAANRAMVPLSADVKWRYFWPVLSHAARDEGRVPELERVVPEGMPGWADVLEKWGCSLLDTVETVSELLALGYGLPEGTFTRLLRNGRHLLAPTGALRRVAPCQASQAQSVLACVASSCAN